MEAKTIYHSLPSSDTEASQEILEFRATSTWRWVSVLFKITVCISLIILGVVTGIFATLKGNGSSWTHCGNTTYEAHQQGCTFDIMMNGWMTSECYNQKLSEEYLARGKFRFFADEFGYHEVPLDVVRRGEHSHIFTTNDHHLSHCAFMWRLQGLALAERRYIDERSIDIPHTAHCAETLLETHVLEIEEPVGNGTRLPIKINTGFIPCMSFAR